MYSKCLLSFMLMVTFDCVISLPEPGKKKFVVSKVCLYVRNYCLLTFFLKICKVVELMS